MMRRLRISRLARAVFAVGLAAVVGLASLLPGFRASPVQPEQVAEQHQEAWLTHAVAPGDTANDYIVVLAVRKGTSCDVANEPNSTVYSEPWRLPASGVTYVIYNASIPSNLNGDQVAQAAQAAASAWVGQGAPSLVYGGTATDAGTIGDGVNTVRFGATPLGAASVATIRVVNGVVAEADITLDSTNPWSVNLNAVGACGGEPDKFDVQGDLAHEFGHWIGAGHTPTTGDFKRRTMFPEIHPAELGKRTPTAGDVASIPSQNTPPSTYSGTAERAGDDDGGP